MNKTELYEMQYPFGDLDQDLIRKIIKAVKIGFNKFHESNSNSIVDKELLPSILRDELRRGLNKIVNKLKIELKAQGSYDSKWLRAQLDIFRTQKESIVRYIDNYLMEGERKEGDCITYEFISRRLSILEKTI